MKSTICEPNDCIKLAKDIIGNELFGKIFSKVLKNGINKVVRGVTAKNDVIAQLKSVFDNFRATKAKNALMSEISSKRDDAVLKTP